MGAFIDLTGKKFNLLTALRKDRYTGYGWYWIFRCDCGKEKSIKGYHVKSGAIKSCGCSKPDQTGKRVRHGHAMSKGKGASPEYYTWLQMMARCRNPKTRHYSLYGGRGISVCERWLIFDNFLADMGLRPSDEYSLDRFPDNDGDYEPGNCRWATMIEQAQNKRSNVYYEYDGRRQILENWGRELNVDPSTINSRLKRGDSFEEVYRYLKFDYKRRKPKRK